MLCTPQRTRWCLGGISFIALTSPCSSTSTALKIAHGWETSHIDYRLFTGVDIICKAGLLRWFQSTHYLGELHVRTQVSLPLAKGAHVWLEHLSLCSTCVKAQLCTISGLDSPEIVQSLYVNMALFCGRDNSRKTLVTESFVNNVTYVFLMGDRNQALTLKPARCGWISAVAGNSILVLSIFLFP